MPSGYDGCLLAVAASADGTELAAAGEAVPAEQLRRADQHAAKYRPSNGGQSPPGPRTEASVQHASSSTAAASTTATVTATDTGAAAAAATSTPTAAAAAAAKPAHAVAAVGGRRGRMRRGVVDFLSMPSEDSLGEVSGIPSALAITSAAAPAGAQQAVSASSVIDAASSAAAGAPGDAGDAGTIASDADGGGVQQSTACGAVGGRTHTGSSDGAAALHEQQESTSGVVEATQGRPGLAGSTPAAVLPAVDPVNASTAKAAAAALLDDRGGLEAAEIVAAARELGMLPPEEEEQIDTSRLTAHVAGGGGGGAAGALFMRAPLFTWGCT